MAEVPWLDLFLNLAIPTVHQEAFLRRGLELSAQYGCSFYDSIYLAVAEAANCPLVHADGKLRNALGGRFPFEFWIEGYPSFRGTP